MTKEKVNRNLTNVSSKLPHESKHTKKLREEYIHFTDDFIFSKVMADVDLCKGFLEIILGEKVDCVVKHEAQKYLAAEYDAKSMRLDVYTETAMTMINTEMQKSEEKQIGKRSRYSGSLMDENQLGRGGDYEHLKARYVIFICSKDPFEKGLCQYTFERVYREDKDVQLNNGIIDIVINLKGDLSGASEEYRELIEYMSERKNPYDCKSVLIHKIHAEVEKANQDAELRRIRVTVGDKYLEIERNSKRDGIEQTIAIIRLHKQGTSVEEIATQLELPLDHIRSIIEKTQ